MIKDAATCNTGPERGEVLVEWRASSDTKTEEEEVLGGSYQRRSRESGSRTKPSSETLPPRTVSAPAPTLEEIPAKSNPNNNNKKWNEALHASLGNVWSGITGGDSFSDDNEEEDLWDQKDRIRTEYYLQQYDKFQYTPEDVARLLVSDDAAFQSLQKALRKRHAVTNGHLTQNLHLYIKKVKDVQAKKRLL
ncbi:expressed unknown protein [Seminavis robusta]|uniref:Uncharacterized protein n=1 Tax=Seminavis robusta TaxID=568900 RepID=A0A9N8E529_9STRA|nr:expressed unknown protein [Seminavis robusta]|eukprot:Sro660_g183040.1 n/a (192) ;mRNA; f:36272-36847